MRAAGIVFTVCCEPYLESEYGADYISETPVKLLDRLLYGQRHLHRRGGALSDQSPRFALRWCHGLCSVEESRMRVVDSLFATLVTGSMEL